MIAPALLLMVQDPSLLGAIPRQALPVRGCAAYLWDNAPTRRLVAMAVADPATLRFSLDGRVVDLARAGQRGVAGYGFAGVTEYRSAEVAAYLDITVETRADLSGGAVVPSATLRIERPGRDVVVTPVAGLIGCV